MTARITVPAQPGALDLSASLGLSANLFEGRTWNVQNSGLSRLFWALATSAPAAGDPGHPMPPNASVELVPPETAVGRIYVWCSRAGATGQLTVTELPG